MRSTVQGSRQTYEQLSVNLMLMSDEDDDATLNCCSDDMTNIANVVVCSACCEITLTVTVIYYVSILATVLEI